MDGYQLLLVGTLSMGVVLLTSVLMVRILDEHVDRNLSDGLIRLFERAKMNDLDVNRELAESLSKIRFPLRKYTDSVAHHSMLEDVVKMVKTARGMESQRRDESRQI